MYWYVLSTYRYIPFYEPEVCTEYILVLLTSSLYFKAYISFQYVPVCTRYIQGTYLREKLCTRYILGVKCMYQVHTCLCRLIAVPYYSMARTYRYELGTYNRSRFQMFVQHLNMQGAWAKCSFSGNCRLSSLLLICGVHKTKVRLGGFKIHAFTQGPINLLSLASKDVTWEIKSNKFKFPVSLNSGTCNASIPAHRQFWSEQQLLRRFQALFRYYRWMLSCHLHLNCTDIKIWQKCSGRNYLSSGSCSSILWFLAQHQ